MVALLSCELALGSVQPLDETARYCRAYVAQQGGRTVAAISDVDTVRGMPWGGHPSTCASRSMPDAPVQAVGIILGRYNQYQRDEVLLVEYVLAHASVIPSLDLQKLMKCFLLKSEGLYAQGGQVVKRKLYSSAATTLRKQLVAVAAAQ